MAASKTLQQTLFVAALLSAGALSTAMSKSQKAAPSGEPPIPSPTLPVPDQACPGSIPSQGEINGRIAELKATVEKAITTTTPNAAFPQYPYGSIGVFSGNYDWHSSVHAHWALLSMARVTGDTAARDFVLNRLTPDAIANVRQVLNDSRNAQFEMPYGQAWLLMMLDEVSKTPAASRPEFAQLKQETEGRLLKYLETANYPEYPQAPKDANRYDAAHMSWLFAYWLVGMSHPSTAAQAELQGALKTKLEAGKNLIPKYVGTIYDFIYLPALIALVEKTGYPVADDPGFYPISAATSHSAGQQMVRIWPIAVQASQGDEPSCAHYQTRMTEMFSRTDQWENDFLNVAHWVPQFMWMSMWLDMKSP